MNEKFTIDDMIEFCESELEYYEKNRDRVHKEHFNCGRIDSPHSLVLGMYSGQAIAYNLIRDQLIELKQSQNEKIKELIDWCQEETDFCIDIMNPEHGYNSYHTHRAEAKKQVLDAVKDKLCSIYDEAKNEIVNHD